MLQDFKYTGSLTNIPVLITEDFKVGTVYLMYFDIFNGRNTSNSYIQLFDVINTSDVVLGTTKPDWVIPVPAQGGHDGAYTPNDYFQGLKFKNGIVAAATKTREGSQAQNFVLDVNFFLV